MQSSEEDTLRQFEALLMEMFSGTCDNTRIREIGKMLDDFSCQPHSWKFCLYFLHQSQNSSVQMYSLNVLDKFITRLWPSVNAEDRLLVRQTLWVFLDKNPSVPSFIRSKVLTVIVVIVRLEWPHDYPDFFHTVYQLIRQDSTSSIGLSFLLTASEELVTPREGAISTTRKQELKDLLLQEAQSIVPLLLDVLRLQAQRHQCSSHSTLPSSPAPFLRTGSPSVPQSLGKIHSFTPFDAAAEEICSLCLRCLTHMSSWIPLRLFVTPAITEMLFYYVFLGCESENDCTDSAGILGHLALGCVNEILQQNFVPSEAEHFMMQIFERTFILLRKLTGASGGDLRTHYASLDDRYLGKCNEYLRLLVSSHLRRIDSNPNFPLTEFLSLFQDHTLKQPQVDSYYLCLEAWHVFLDHVITSRAASQEGRTSQDPSHLAKYKEPLMNLLEGLVKKILMDINTLELSELDDDRLDSDNETEWQCFVRQTTEIFALIAELFPMEAFQKLIPLLENFSVTFFQIKDHLYRQGKDLCIHLEGVDGKGLHARLRDLCTVLQMLGRLAEHLAEPHFLARFDLGNMLFDRFCCIAKFSSDHELYSVMLEESSDESFADFDSLDRTFMEVHAHSLGALNALCYSWLPTYHLCALRDSEPRCSDCAVKVEALCQLGLPLLVEQIPERISVSAGHMLVTLSHAVRPQQLTQLPLIQGFILQGSQGRFNQLPNLIGRLSYRIVSNIFVMPWPEVPTSQQHWDSRSHEFGKFIDGAMQSLLDIGKLDRFGERPEVVTQAEPLIVQSLSALEEMVAGVGSEGTRSTMVMYQAVEKIIDLSLVFFQHCLSNSRILSAVMSFFQTVFKNLKVQEKSGRTQTAVILTIMKLLDSQVFKEMLISNDPVSCNVMQKFLSILTDQVSTQSSFLKVELPNIITFCLEAVYTTVEKLPVPDVKLELYKLLAQILMHNWRYFFRSNILTRMEGEDDESVVCVGQFRAIMQIYLQSFMQPEIELFRENLTALQELNRRHSLFSKTIFKTDMLPLFVHVLLEVLVQKSHDLLGEDIGACLHAMACSSFQTFHREVLPSFLCKFPQLSQEQRDKLAQNYKLEEDLPSFLRNIHQLSCDLRYYFLLNASLKPLT
uniref:Exportin-6 n=1 Tax=Halisarca dujardinii TaxID=2583056 RepID=A0AAU8KYK8_HALDU